MTPVALLVVDDHKLFRRGIVALLSQDARFKVVGEAGDIGEALRCVVQVCPDLILLDNHLPGVLGVDGIAALKEAAPDTRILMLTVSENEDDLAAALQAGADGYLLKTVELDSLCESIIKVLGGESVVSPEMMTKLVAAFRAKPQVAVGEGSAPGPQDLPALLLLSAREREVLALIAFGDSNKLIARKLNIAETTVKIHVQHILRKLQLSSRVQAAVYAAGLPLH
ncbi:response regulator [Polaromonas sp.]|uniref:response regulator n=1 Tax=Polaromonas sp. TaxID=1869339 RepID=UPI0035654995